MFDVQRISTFLHFGYLPRISSDVEFEVWARNVKKHDPIKAGTDESRLVIEGVRSLKASFMDPVGEVHIVPLSGGLDSRTILGGLLDAGLRDQITTITYGTPGTLDYEIGNCVAKKMGLRHKVIDLTQVELNQELLEKMFNEGEAWTFLIPSFYHSLIRNRFGKDATYWSGFMGGALSGAQLPTLESRTWEEAKTYFAN